MDGLTLTASFGYVDPKFKKYPTALSGGLVDPGCLPIANSAGVTFLQDCAATAAFTYFPKTTANASVTYELPAASYGTWSFFLSYYYQGRTQMSAFKTASLPYKDFVVGKAYGLLNGRIALSDIPLSGAVRGQISLFGENLTNKKYNAQGIDFQSFGTITWGEPRTFGVEGKVQF
jgi:iron complex outermembrane receptor protein